jgi:hypothetical protein
LRRAIRCPGPGMPAVARGIRNSAFTGVPGWAGRACGDARIRGLWVDFGNLGLFTIAQFERTSSPAKEVLRPAARGCFATTGGRRVPVLHRSPAGTLDRSRVSVVPGFQVEGQDAIEVVFGSSSHELFRPLTLLANQLVGSSQWARRSARMGSPCRSRCRCRGGPEGVDRSLLRHCSARSALMHLPRESPPRRRDNSPCR